ncbi:MAG: recombinase family protein [Atopobiaceae bacterium]
MCGTLHYSGYLSRKGDTWQGSIEWADWGGRYHKEPHQLEAKREAEALTELQSLCEMKERELFVSQWTPITDADRKRGRKTDTAEYVAHFLDLPSTLNPCGYGILKNQREHAKEYYRPILQEFRGTPLKDLSTDAVELWEMKLFHSYSHRTPEQLETIAGARYMLHSALQNAVRTGTLKRNPAYFMRTPAYGRSNHAKRFSYAYIRQTEDADIDSQIQQVQQNVWPTPIEDTYLDRESESGTERPQLHRLISDLRRGDTVCIASLDRIADSSQQLEKLIERFGSIGVHLESWAERLDTSEPFGTVWPRIFHALEDMDAKAAQRQQAE